METRLFCDIPERDVSLIVEKHQSVAGGNDEIGTAVIVVVAHCTAHSFSVKVEAGCVRDILESSFTRVAIKCGMALAIGVDQENIRAAIAVVIKDACPAAEKLRERFRCVLGIASRDILVLASYGSAPDRATDWRLGWQSDDGTDIDEMDGNGGRGCFGRLVHFLR